MPLLYTAIQSVLENKDGEKLWHPRILKVGDPMTVYELGVEVSKRSSMSAGDALNIIETAQDIIRQNLMNSRSVCLDRLGTFTVTCRSAKNGVKTEEEVSSKQISELKVRFTPSYTRSTYNGTTRAMFEGVTFEKVYKGNVKREQNTNNPNPGDDGEDIVDPGA